MEFCQLTASIGPGSPTLRREEAWAWPKESQSRSFEQCEDPHRRHSNILITLATLVGSLIINDSLRVCRIRGPDVPVARHYPVSHVSWLLPTRQGSPITQHFAV